MHNHRRWPTHCGIPNRRVRFAALRAIMTLDPKSPYPGSSRVPEAFAWFAGGTGERRGARGDADHRRRDRIWPACWPPRT